MQTPTTPGEAIRLARLISHMGQEHLALAAGVSERTVRRVEKGEAISAESMRSICATLQIDARTVGRGRPQATRAKVADGPVPAANPARAPECPWRHDAGLRLPMADGGFWSYAPGTSVQDSSIDIVAGRPGTGKSTLLHGASLVLCGLGEGGNHEPPRPLPRIVSFDAGPTATAWAERVRNGLPEHRRSEVAILRLSNAAQKAVNPFETPLGWRRPGEAHRAHLVNLLSELTSCEVMPLPSKEAAAYLREAVDAAYRRSYPYEAGRNARVDDLVGTLFQRAPRTWWEVVDRLFEAGHVEEAHVAHGEAVPNLPRLLQVLMDVDPSDPWEDVFDRRTTKIVLSQVMRSLQEFPVLAGPTVERLDGARIVALDLDGVLPRGSGPAERQRSVMYLVARSFARDLFDHEDDLSTLDGKFLRFPGIYGSFHERRIRDLRHVPRRLVYDEVDRAYARGAFRSQTVLDVREARKRGVQVALGTQVPGEVDAAVVDMSTGLFLLGDGTSPTPARLDEADRAFGLGDGERAALSEGGSLAVFFTKQGRISTPFLTLGDGAAPAA